MFKTCSDPDFNWVHCLCDSATWVVKEPGKPIGFFYSRLFDDALSPSGLGFAVDAFRIDEDGTLDDFYSDILWDYGAADELIAAYPNKFNCVVRCDGLNPYDIPTSWSQDKGERYRARDTVLAAVDMLTDEADEAGIDACPEFYRNDYISMYLKTQGLAVAQRALLVQAAKSMREDSPDEAFASLSRAIALIRATDERAGDVSDHTLAHNLLISGFEEMERDNTRLISRQISEGRLDIGEIARAFVGAMGRKTGTALEGKHAGCYSRDVDALVFTDDDIDDYANMIEHSRPDLDFIQCREIASQAVTDWNDGHAMDGFTEFLYDYANEHAPAESVKQGGGIRY